MANPRINLEPKGNTMGMRCSLALAWDKHLRCKCPSCCCSCHEDDVTYPPDQYPTTLYGTVLQSDARRIQKDVSESIS